MGELGGLGCCRPSSMLPCNLSLGVKTNLLSGNLGVFILLLSLHVRIYLPDGLQLQGEKKNGMMNQLQTVGAL